MSLVKIALRVLLAALLFACLASTSCGVWDALLGKEGGHNDVND